MGQSEVRTSNDVMVNLDQGDMAFVYSVPKSYASLVLLHVKQLNCSLFLKH